MRRRQQPHPAEHIQLKGPAWLHVYYSEALPSQRGGFAYRTTEPSVVHARAYGSLPRAPLCGDLMYLMWGPPTEQS